MKKIVIITNNCVYISTTTNNVVLVSQHVLNVDETNIKAYQLKSIEGQTYSNIDLFIECLNEVANNVIFSKDYGY